MKERALFKVSVTITHTTEITRLLNYIVNTYSVNDAIDDVLKSITLDGFVSSAGYEWNNIHAMKLVRQIGIINSY